MELRPRRWSRLLRLRPKLRWREEDHLPNLGVCPERRGHPRDLNLPLSSPPPPHSRSPSPPTFWPHPFPSAPLSPPPPEHPSHPHWPPNLHTNPPPPPPRPPLSLSLPSSRQLHRCHRQQQQRSPIPHRQNSLHSTLTHHFPKHLPPRWGVKYHANCHRFLQYHRHRLNHSSPGLRLNLSLRL